MVIPSWLVCLSAGAALGLVARCAARTLHPVLHVLQLQTGEALGSRARQQRLRVLRRRHRHGLYFRLLLQPHHDVCAQVSGACAVLCVFTRGGFS